MAVAVWEGGPGTMHVVGVIPESKHLRGVSYVPNDLSRAGRIVYF
jgi:hypothetical protein